MENTEMIIAAIEAKGYNARKMENIEMGVVNELCPVVYNIYDQDYSQVYGANGIAPEQLSNWLSLPAINRKSSKAETNDINQQAESDRKASEKDWDNVYNEGAEGYNPYRL